MPQNPKLSAEQDTAAATGEFISSHWVSQISCVATHKSVTISVGAKERAFWNYVHKNLGIK